MLAHIYVVLEVLANCTTTIQSEPVVKVYIAGEEDSTVVTS